MRKKILFIISLLILVLTYKNTFAKDTVYSLNKYNNESFKIIEESYTNKQKNDGYIVGGTYKKNVDDNEIYSMIVKYTDIGTVSWTYTDKDSVSDISYSSYSYDEDNNIDGYIFSIYNKDENKSQFVELSLKGKLVDIKDSSLDSGVIINKFIPIYTSDKIIDGYISISSNDDKTYLTRYDKNLNLSWNKEYTEEGTTCNYLDLVPINDNNATGYAVLVESIYDGKSTIKLLDYDIDGNLVKTIKDDFEENDNPKLEVSNNGFILYGLTHELKLSNNKSTSYYIINYNSNLENINESIGNTAITEDKTIKLQPIVENNKIKEYLLLYTNDDDSSIEVVKIDKNGTEISKIKKINNEYYDINNFSFSNDTLYIIGQINCPEDDDCEYNGNSLFLISDEDKVIEVKESDNKSIIIISVIIILILIVLAYIINKKRKKLK